MFRVINTRFEDEWFVSPLIDDGTDVTAGKHLVLVTDPEIVEDAYAFDNPCFKDATPTTVGRVTERPSSAVLGDTPAKDSTRWSTPWTSLGLGSAIRNDKRRTLDDSYVGVSRI